MLFDATLSEQQNAKMLRLPYLIQNLCWNNRSEDVLSPQHKPIVSPIFGDCTISFVFLKKFSKVKIIFSISNKF